MSAKASAPPSLTEINKKIVEIKKKIQLSEGQRKAAFEEYETERKTNADLILKLKKEVTELNLTFHENKDTLAVNRVQNMQLETVVGPLKQRTMREIIDSLDLQNIDLNKQLDLLKHRKKQRQQYMTKLANEYQTLLSGKPNREVQIKIDNPLKKKIIALQNNIHSIEMQWREALHVKKSYKNIRTILLEDAGRFESKIKSLEEQIQEQQNEIQQLQKVNAEAAKNRSQARGTLEREERIALNSEKIRERQTSEYKRLVADRKLELERLERKIFQSGKAPVRPETADDLSQTDQEEGTTPTEDQESVLKEAFNKLKEVTGATSIQEVLQRFKGQRDTRKRLDFLRRTTELEKRQLESKQNKLISELENYKYAQEIDKEKTGEGIIRLKNELKCEEERQKKIEKETEDKNAILQSICRALYIIYTSLREIGIKPKFLQSDIENGEKIINVLHMELTKVVEVLEDRDVSPENICDTEEVEEQHYTDEMLLPQTYNVLLRRMPVLPTQVGTPAVVGSDDEEEVPSRGFLKRQAQLVVDAKRRKNIRIPISRK